MTDEPSTLHDIQELLERMDLEMVQRFDRWERRFDTLDLRIAELHQRVATFGINIEAQLDDLKAWVDARNLHYREHGDPK